MDMVLYKSILLISFEKNVFLKVGGIEQIARLNQTENRLISGLFECGFPTLHARVDFKFRIEFRDNVYILNYTYTQTHSNKAILSINIYIP